MKNILIGTSGYDYPEWKGVFYPLDLKRADFLKYYASQFNALELNNTFYNMPTAERLLSYYERSEGKLKFSIKANRLLTHEISFNWQTVAADLKLALTPLLNKDCLSAILFQFPESFHYSNDNRIYLAKVIQAFFGFPIVIEFRHRDWIKESVFDGLEKRKAGIVFCDMPMCVSTTVNNFHKANGPLAGRMPQLKNLPDGTLLKTPFIGDTAYIRLHGRNASAWYVHEAQNNGSARYCYDYSDEELKSFVPIINAAVQEGKKVQVYFNNHPSGSGAKNALKLQELLENSDFNI